MAPIGGGDVSARVAALEAEVFGEELEEREKRRVEKLEAAALVQKENAPEVEEPTEEAPASTDDLSKEELAEVTDPGDAARAEFVEDAKPPKKQTKNQRAAAKRK